MVIPAGARNNLTFKLLLWSGEAMISDKNDTKQR